MAMRTTDPEPGLALSAPPLAPVGAPPPRPYRPRGTATETGTTAPRVENNPFHTAATSDRPLGSRVARRPDRAGPRGSTQRSSGPPTRGRSTGAIAARGSHGRGVAHDVQ